MTDLLDLQERYRAFSTERHWNQFHDPKSLILALTGEVGELAELFQWIPADEAVELFSSGQPLQRAKEELADVAIYAMGIANALNIDLAEAIEEKMKLNAVRFPVSDVDGIAPDKL